MKAQQKRPEVMARRRQVLQWVCEGKSYPVISTIMGVNERLVKRDVEWWQLALDARDKALLAARATARGLIDVSRVALFAVLTGSLAVDDRYVKRAQRFKLDRTQWELRV